MFRSTLRKCAIIPALLSVLAFTACDADPAPCVAAKGEVCTIAGTGELGFNQDELPATKSDFYLPSAARRGPDGMVYVMDFNNQRLRRIDEAGKMETVIGDGFHALANTGVPALESPLENPIDFDFFPDGRVVFVSYHDPRVLVLEADGTLQSIAGAGEVGTTGNEGDNGDALSALFIQLDGIVIGRDNTVYVSDSKAHRVREIRDGIVRSIAGTGVRAYTGDGGPAVDAALNWPTALAQDKNGDLLIADARNHVVRKVDADGIITTVAGTGERGYSGDGHAAKDAQLNQPTGLAVGADGSLYISDRGNFVVRKVSTDGRIETLAGTGVKGASGDGGPAVDAEFSQIARVYLDEEDTGLFIADQANSLVRRVTFSTDQGLSDDAGAP